MSLTTLRWNTAALIHQCPHVILRDLLCLRHVVCFTRKARPSRCGCATASLPAGVLHESTIHQEASSSFCSATVLCSVVVPLSGAADEGNAVCDGTQLRRFRMSTSVPLPGLPDAAAPRRHFRRQRRRLLKQRPWDRRARWLCSGSPNSDKGPGGRRRSNSPGSNCNNDVLGLGTTVAEHIIKFTVTHNSASNVPKIN